MRPRRRRKRWRRPVLAWLRQRWLRHRGHGRRGRHHLARGVGQGACPSGLARMLLQAGDQPAPGRIVNVPTPVREVERLHLVERARRGPAINPQLHQLVLVKTRCGFGSNNLRRPRAIRPEGENHTRRRELELGRRRGLIRQIERIHPEVPALETQHFCDQAQPVAVFASVRNIYIRHGRPSGPPPATFVLAAGHRFVEMDDWKNTTQSFPAHPTLADECQAKVTCSLLRGRKRRSATRRPRGSGYPAARHAVPRTPARQKGPILRLSASCQLHPARTRATVSAIPPG